MNVITQTWPSEVQSLLLSSSTSFIGCSYLTMKVLHPTPTSYVTWLTMYPSHHCGNGLALGLPPDGEAFPPPSRNVRKQRAKKRSAPPGQTGCNFQAAPQPPATKKANHSIQSVPQQWPIYETKLVTATRLPRTLHNQNSKLLQGEQLPALFWILTIASSPLTNCTITNGSKNQHKQRIRTTIFQTLPSSVVVSAKLPKNQSKLKMTAKWTTSHCSDTGGGRRKDATLIKSYI